MTQSSSNNEVRAAKERGGAHYAGKRFAEAISSYTYCIDHAASEDPELYLYYSNRCACYMQMQDYVLAKGDAESCISLKPTFSKGYSRLGNCLLKLNKVQEAIYALERCSELDPSNYEAANALSRARDLLYRPGRGGSYGSSPGQGSFDAMSQLTQLLATAKQWCTRGLTQGLLYWNSMTSTQQQIAGGLVVAVLVYYLFFSGGGGYDSYSGGYGGNYGGYGYGGGGGLSWTVWGSLMAAGYYVPPLLVDVIGPQYARPYFGMSWTTFMWLLNMLGNRTGGMGMGGMGGGGLGGLFGRRRRYNY